MSALPIDRSEEPRLARVLTRPHGWQYTNTDVVTVLGCSGAKLLVRQLNKPYRTALIAEEFISFSCECDDGGPAVHLVRAKIRDFGDPIEYLVCDTCFASEQYIQKRIEWKHINQPVQEEPVTVQPMPEIEEQPEQPKRVRPRAATGPALVEQAEALWALMKKHSWSARSAGQHLGITQIKSSELSRLMRGPEDLREAVRRGEMSLYAALAETKARPERRLAKMQPAPVQEEELGAEGEQMIRAALHEIARDWTKEEREALEQKLAEARRIAEGERMRVLSWIQKHEGAEHAIEVWKQSAKKWRAEARKLKERDQNWREVEEALMLHHENRKLIEERDDLRQRLYQALANQQPIIVNGGTVTIITKES